MTDIKHRITGRVLWAEEAEAWGFTTRHWQCARRAGR